MAYLINFFLLLIKIIHWILNLIIAIQIFRRLHHNYMKREAQITTLNNKITTMSVDFLHTLHIKWSSAFIALWAFRQIPYEIQTTRFDIVQFTFNRSNKNIQFISSRYWKKINSSSRHQFNNLLRFKHFKITSTIFVFWSWTIRHCYVRLYY